MDRARRRLILTNLNATVYPRRFVRSFLSELVVTSLLYEEVLIRDDDLIGNATIAAHLADEKNRQIFEELLRVGAVRLLGLGKRAYGPDVRRDPHRDPVSARAEEHEQRRSDRGRPWRATQHQWLLYESLDRVVRAHRKVTTKAPRRFPETNRFAVELQEILENPTAYRLGERPDFADINGPMADRFIEFCSTPGAWLKFLADHGVEKPLLGTEGGFYRTAAYQCLEMFPHHSGMSKLIESVYAACDCDRENSDGRYGRGALTELPYRVEPSEESDAAAQYLVKIEMVPKVASVEIGLAPGIAEVVAETRTSAAFRQLQSVLASLGSAHTSEAMVGEAWNGVSSVFAEQWGKRMVRPGARDHRIARYAVDVYGTVHALGFVLNLIHAPHPSVLLLEHHLVATAIEHCALNLSQQLRAALAVPKVFERTQRAAAIRCTRIRLGGTGRIAGQS